MIKEIILKLNKIFITQPDPILQRLYDLNLKLLKYLEETTVVRTPNVDRLDSKDYVREQQLKEKYNDEDQPIFIRLKDSNILNITDYRTNNIDSDIIQISEGLGVTFKNIKKIRELMRKTYKEESVMTKNAENSENFTYEQIMDLRYRNKL